MTDLHPDAGWLGETPYEPAFPIRQPRTTLLPPAPGRHHWCVVIPPSTLPQFDAPTADSALHAELVEALWERGIGCARFDLFPPTSSVAVGHPAAFGRQLTRAIDVLDRLHRIDQRGEVTLLAAGDAVEVALALSKVTEGKEWPVLRGLLLVPPTSAMPSLDRQAADLADLIANDERPVAAARRPRVTGQLLRRLGF